MKNALNFFYKLNPKEIHQINKIIKFSYLSKNYILYQTNREYKELVDVYKLHKYLLAIGIYCHKIILNTNNEIITKINNKHYVLLEINIENRIININDILYMTSIVVDSNEFINIKRQNWYNLWIKKNDYIEYQISQFGKKYELIRESSDYYIGIAENCISLLNNVSNSYNQEVLTICHNRINKKTTTEQYYNPIEFILDRKVRDIGEYIKSFTNYERIIEQIKILKYNNFLKAEEIEFLFIRIMYPSEYFDIYELIINNALEQKTMKKIINKRNDYETMIKKIYNFIRSISNLPEIEWLMEV